MTILNFNDFVNEAFGEIDPTLKKGPAVGVAIICQNKILLVHPTGASWHSGSCGIPKGGLEPGEEPMLGALRELKEETGISLEVSQLDPEPNVVDLYNKKKEVDRQLIYYVCTISSPAEIGLSFDLVPKNQLQLEEIDWAKFVSPEEAYRITTRAQLIILDRHLKINN